MLGRAPLNDDGTTPSATPSPPARSAAYGKCLQGGWRIGLALLIVGLVLRPQITGIASLFPLLSDDLKVRHATVGLLTTIPVLCMGLIAPFGGRLTARVGAQRVVLLSLVVLGVAGIARSGADTIVVLLALTLPLGFATGVATAAQPVAVREGGAARPGLATAMYSSGIQIGAAAAAALAVPLAHLAGGWHTTLLIYSVITLVFAVAARGLLRAERVAPADRGTQPKPSVQPASGHLTPPGEHARRLSTVTAVLAAAFALQGILYYGLSAWLPALFVQRGWSQSAAGGLLGVMNLAGLVGSVSLALSIDHWGSRSTHFLLATMLVTLGVLGFAEAPSLATPCAIAAGLGLSGLFVVMLLLPVDIGRSQVEVGTLAGRMIGFGYVIAAVSPAVLGALSDLTGSFVPGMWLLFGICLLLLALSRHLIAYVPAT